MSKIELDDPLEALYEKEVELMDEAAKFIVRGIPNKEITIKTELYISENIRYQERLNNLKSMLRHTYNKRYRQLKLQEAEEWTELQDENYPATDRRILLVRNPQVRDLTNICDVLDILAKRVDSMEWELKEALRALSG